MRVRVSWVIVLVVIVIAAAVPSVRQIWHVLFNVRAYYFAPAQNYGEYEIPTPRADVLAKYRPEAAYFVAEKAPDDPELLLGAGLIADDKERALELLREAAEKSNSAAAWAAYSIRLMNSLPSYFSLAESGGYPTTPESKAESRKMMEEQQAKGIPERLLPEDIAPAMEALKKWEAVDPQNALPVALELQLLGAVVRYDEALPRWEAAARLPKVDLHLLATQSAVARLLTRMGVPEPEAIQTAMVGNYAGNLAATAKLRQVARIAQYEGGLARAQGRDGEALRWWHATTAVGRTMQESGEDYVSYVVGVAIEAIGAMYEWKWWPGTAVGLTNGPLFGGAFFYGDYHDWYARQVGAAEDIQVRDRLVRAKLRTLAPLHYSASVPPALLRLHQGWVAPLEFSLTALMCFLLFLIVYAAARPWRRDEADEATGLRWPGSLLLAVLAVAPLVAGFVYALSLDPNQIGRAWQVIADSAFLSLIAAIALPALSARYTQAASYRHGATWLANHRRLLPNLLALTALLYLFLMFATAQRRHAWAQEWRQGKHNEFAQMKQALGGEWDNPKVPAGAWHAQYPVLQTPRPGQP